MTWRRPPPRIGQRIHYAPGEPPNPNDWSGEVRAIVDDDWIVVRRFLRRKNRWAYFVEWRWWWDNGHWQPGPLPRARVRAGEAVE